MLILLSRQHLLFYQTICFVRLSGNDLSSGRLHAALCIAFHLCVRLSASLLASVPTVIGLWGIRSNNSLYTVVWLCSLIRVCLCLCVFIFVKHVIISIWYVAFFSKPKHIFYHILATGLWVICGWLDFGGNPETPSSIVPHFYSRSRGLYFHWDRNSSYHSSPDCKTILPKWTFKVY